MTDEQKPKRDRSETPDVAISRELGKLDEIKLGRIGHYSYNGVCQTALIVEAGLVDTDDAPVVNLAVWTHGGTALQRPSVKVSLTGAVDDDQATFHLTRDCPDGK